jgi:uncharacterized iron-regulated membrane protein
LKALWAVLGFAPVLMFATGAIMWWNRVVRKRPARNVAEAAVAEPIA